MSKINVYATAKKVTKGARDLLEDLAEVKKDIDGYKKTIQKLRDKLNDEVREKEFKEKEKAQKLEEEKRKRQEEIKRKEIERAKEELRRQEEEKAKKELEKREAKKAVQDERGIKTGQRSTQTQLHDIEFKDPKLIQAQGLKGQDSPRVSKDEDQMHRRRGRKSKKDRWEENQLKPRSQKPKNSKAASKKRQEKTEMIPERKKAIVMGEIISIKELSEKIGVPATEIMKKLMGLGILATINQDLDYETAAIVSAEFGIQLEQKASRSFEELLIDEDMEDDPSTLVTRPPIVTVMGHVDHGKTSLLDAIRSARVTAQEAGGITQHIGAYTVKVDDKPITFLDTPGHEAFTSMRARGAQVTDIAILVVAANDGVMPQTVEAINHAKEAGVPILVAINKIDVTGANPDRVKQELTEHDLIVEEWGGDTIAVPVSALHKEGIDNLLEMVLLLAEMQELKANPNRLAKGTIIEAELDRGRGPVATVLVQKGTLKVGDSIVAGTAYGRVRAMMDHRGKRLKKAGPSTPVQVLGLTEVPEAGDIMHCVKDDKLAKQVAEERKLKAKEQQIRASSKLSLDELFSKIKEGEVKDLNLIIKADVQGSVEAVKQSLEKLSNEEVRVKAIHGGVGAINESDVMLATASNAIIIGFNVRPSAGASELASKEKIDIRTYRVIYNAIEDIEAAMKGMLDPEYKEVIIGHAEVRETFKVPGAGVVAGSYVTDGKILRNADARIVRNGIVIYEGKIESLRRFKDDVREVASGYECGISLENFNDIKKEDIIEVSIQEEIKK